MKSRLQTAFVRLEDVSYLILIVLAIPLAILLIGAPFVIAAWLVRLVTGS